MIYQYHDRGLKKRNSFNERSRSKLLLAYGLYKEFGIKNTTIIRNSFGKPMLKEHPDLFISVSHTIGTSALIISRNRVGIDMEMIRPYRTEAETRVLHEIERKDLAEKNHKDMAFFQLFTLKESYIKALGCGFSYPVKTVWFRVDDVLNVTSNKAYATFRVFEDKKGNVISVCFLPDKNKTP